MEEAGHPVGCRPQRYTALNGCVKENELVQNLTIIQHKVLGLVPVFFLKANQLTVAIQGVLWTQKNHSTIESGCGLGVFWEILMKITLTLVILLSNLLWHSGWTSAIAECLFLHAVMHQVLPFPLAMRGVSIF